jgi:hypothetical protein
MARRKPPVELTIVEPDHTVYVVEPTGWHRPMVSQPRTAIVASAPSRERVRYGVDVTRITDNTVPIRTTPTGFSIRLVK